MRIKTVMGLMAAVMLVGFSANQANAQLRHGISIQKGCDGPLCIGDTTNCTFLVSHNDDYGDTTTLMEAYDQLDTDGNGVFETRIPAAGNLPIIQVGGNTTCTVAGSLPCTLGPADVGAGLEAGFVIFQQNQYVIGPDDVSPLQDQAHVIWKDQCDAPGTSNCSTAVNDANAPAATLFPNCDDGDACTNDSCEAGVCTNAPMVCDDDNACTSDACVGGICVFTTSVDCNDDNLCTDDSCDPATGACINEPNVDCNDNNACTEDSCDPATGACINEPNVDCNDNNACTEDSCDPATGACINEPNVDCNDNNACTNDSCDPATGACVNEPFVDCNDNNACTEDSCDPATGACINEPNVDCNDNNACTIDSCDPATGACVNEPDSSINCDDQNACTADRCDPATGACINEPSVTCDDNNVCTEDTCDPATGDCIFTDIVPAPPGCATYAGCTPGFWKVRQHFVYWVGYSPSDLWETVFGVDAIILHGKTLVEAAGTGGGGEAALGRHAVAALLNSTNDEVDYFYSTAQVIAMVQQAYATGEFTATKNLFAAQNELGCTVDTSGQKSGDSGHGWQDGR